MPAQATNGDFAHGDGLKAKGMGGTATALAQDGFGGANNPASTVRAGSRVDLGLDGFCPERSAQRSGEVDSGSRNFDIPEFGANTMRHPALAVDWVPTTAPVSAGRTWPS